jgi:hypothetical protein
MPGRPFPWHASDKQGPISALGDTAREPGEKYPVRGGVLKATKFGSAVTVSFPDAPNAVALKPWKVGAVHRNESTVPGSYVPENTDSVEVTEIT